MSTTPITTPKTYAEWVEVLDLLKTKADDEQVLQAMRDGSLEWQTGIAERFSAKLIDAINLRMNNATDRFQKDMNRCHGQEREIVLALLGLRKELSFLAKAIDLPVLPEKDRAHYKKLVTDHANKIQSSLENSAKADRTGKLASLVRNHKVNAL